MTTATNDKQMLTEAEAAEVLGIRPQTLTAWRTLGRYNLPFAKIGRTVRYRRSDLEAFIERRTATSVAGCE